MQSAIKAPRIITSVLALKPQRGVIEYKLQRKLHCPQSQTPCKWNLSKPDCKTPLIQFYFISSPAVKSLPFKITFATHREELHCHWGTVAGEFFRRGKCWPTSWWIMKTNTFFFVCFIQGKDPAAGISLLLKGFWDSILFWGNVEEIGALILLFPLIGKSVIHPLTVTSLHVWQSNQLSGAGKWWWAIAVQFCNPAVSSYEGSTSLHGLYFIGQHVYA